MTTAHRPTFDPAKGKEAQRGPAYHQRLLPAHKTLKVRREGQGGTPEVGSREELRLQLLEAEITAQRKKKGITDDDAAAEDSSANANVGGGGEKRKLENGPAADEEGDADETPEQKRKRLVLEKYKDVDADSDDDEDKEDDSSEEEDSDDDEDETSALMRELEKIKRERAEKKAAEEAEKAKEEEDQREFDIARGNPLLNPRDFNVKRRWDDDVVFKNQARGAEERDRKPKEFVNDLLRSDFHRRFMSRYVR
ncbi:Cwf15/Cwc15 cell cycle control protein [Saccharata proteae CBS 121410]|uniref:Cwf15/Cwc15 cell cycle control protein n=1 Tax=Saccharata proteae CBS 121410 TaxID=1314787 RepID=A0A9P4LXV5_9PEZI|nr:Cwf15/Cwc15 cell cycle control protein [Saccharata proteae CBS 121410]